MIPPEDSKCIRTMIRSNGTTDVYIDGVKVRTVKTLTPHVDTKCYLWKPDKMKECSWVLGPMPKE